MRTRNRKQCLWLTAPWCRAQPTSQPLVHVGQCSQVESGNRSWQKEAIIIGGSTAAGAGIGAIAGGKKGAAIGAISGGVAGLIYDMKTRKNGDRC